MPEELCKALVAKRRPPNFNEMHGPFPSIRCSGRRPEVERGREKEISTNNGNGNYIHVETSEIR